MIRRTTLADLRTRGAALFAAAAAETNIPGDVQWQHLEQIDRIGWLRLLGVEVAGELVGYCCAAVGPELWGGGCALTTLSLFVVPRHRAQWGRPLLYAIVEEGAAAGCSVVRIQSLAGSRLERLLHRLGWEPCAVAFERQVVPSDCGPPV